MTDRNTQAHADESNMQKDPDQWTTGDEPMTGAQRSYLKTLCEEAKVAFDDKLTKAQASKRIDELQRTTGRGKPQDSADRDEKGLTSTDPTGNPGSLGKKGHEPMPKGAPSAG
jgi:hypothetical protein